MTTSFYVKNLSKKVTDDQVKIMIKAQELQLKEFCKDWRIGKINIKFVDDNFVTTGDPQFFIEFVDNDPYEESVAWHTQQGKKVFSRIFCDFILRNGGCVLNIGEKKNGEKIDTIYTKAEHKKMGNVFSIASAFSHEVLEQTINPYVNLWGENLVDGKKWSYEVCDMVQEDNMWVSVDGYKVSMSNYVLPQWFDWDRKEGPFDWRGKLKAPFTMSPGGYAIIMNKNGRQQTLFGRQTPKWAYDTKIHKRLQMIQTNNKSSCILM